MKIPMRGIEKFVRELVDQCTVSQRDRIQRGLAYRNYALHGAEQVQGAAVFNKTWTYLGDLASLMYSPVSLRFNISDPDVPSLIQETKGRAAATRMRSMYRQSNTDTLLSTAVWWALVQGKTFVKQTFKRKMLASDLIQPQAMGVLNEAHGALDEDMEAFCHSMLITPYQFTRAIWNNPRRDTLVRHARSYMREQKSDMAGTDRSAMQVIVGGLYPFQPAGTGQNVNRGIVDWMGGGAPVIDPKVAEGMLRLDELWVWDDEREDWATFQIIGDKMLIFGDTFIANKLAWNIETKTEAKSLKGVHPFREFCANPVDGYFWGRSEIINVMLLQYALNQRINGINRLLRKQEDPPKKITGAAGVNQAAISRYNKPGGWWSDTNPNAKLEEVIPTITADLWNDEHELERMFDEMGGLPPVARGRGEAGVRGAGHAETLIRMATPRLKDSALLLERNVESLGALSLDLVQAHVDKPLIAWMPPDAAGIEGAKSDPLLKAPVEGFVPVYFTFADLPDEMAVTVDSHSSSPAFQQEARALLFDLFKIQAIDQGEVIQRSDVTDSEGLIAGLQRRQAAQAAQLAKLQQEDPEAALKLMQGGKKK
jgi:hypothetical protein